MNNETEQSGVPSFTDLVGLNFDIIGGEDTTVRVVASDVWPTHIGKSAAGQEGTSDLVDVLLESLIEFESEIPCSQAEKRRHVKSAIQSLRDLQANPTCQSPEAMTSVLQDVFRRLLS